MITAANFSSPATPGSRTIGVLVDNLFYYYSAGILQGILNAAESYNIRLLCFVGGMLKTSVNLGSRGNYLYDLVHDKTADGVVILSGGVGNYTTHEELSAFVHRYSHLPVASIGSRIEGVPSILADNEFGMGELMHHFIRDHQRRRIAFIGGPSESEDSIIRFNVYRRVLDEHGLPFDPALIYHGNFIPHSGAEAIAEFVDRLGLSFDAVVAANDEMAGGALKALRARGVTVPDDILVSGFDDSITARSGVPPLTTVRQPLAEMGAAALRCVMRQLDGVPVSAEEVLPTRMVVRASCGCYVKQKIADGDVRLRHARGLAKKTQVITEAAAELARGYPFIAEILGDSDWATRLATVLFDELDGYDDAFLSHLQKLIAAGIPRAVPVSTWSDIVFDLFRALPEFVRHRERFGSLTHDAFTFLTHQIESTMTLHQQGYEQQTLALYRANLGLMKTLNFTQFRDLVAQMFLALGLRDCCLSLYDTDRNYCRAAVLLRNAHPTDDVSAGAGGDRFPVTDIVPGGVASLPAKTIMFVLPLSFEEEDLGILICNYDNHVSYPVYETLGGQISTAVKTLRMVEQLVAHADELEREVVRRTGDLQRKSVEIQRLNEELLQKSKLDSLTGLYNRKAFFEFLRMELNRVRRQAERRGEVAGADDATFSVLMMDLDRFKQINDTHGHIAGDRVLQAIGALLRRAGVLRAEDIAGRFGGEEFVVLLVGANAGQALAPAQRLVDEFGAMRFEDGRESFRVTLSVGVAEYRASDKDILDVIQRADQALYAAKQRGRNRVEVFENAMESTRTG